MQRCIECNAKCKKASEKCSSWKPVKCDQCDVVCSAAGNLKRHIKMIHDKIKDYACDQCEYKCSIIGTLNRHIKMIHLRIQDHLCDQCEFKSSEASNLQTHVKAVHDKIRDHSCDQCEFTCSEASNLRDHVDAVHLQIKDHPCDRCEYKSSKASDLQTHVKAVHNKIKDHSCDQCEFKCSKASNLRAHAKICNGEETCSAGESKLRRILDEMGIEWTNGSHEIRNPLTGRLLQWDILIWQFGEPIFIEYDGRQHFEVVEYFGGQAEFDALQARDKLKDDYCRDEGYLLLRIPFTQYENMEAIVVDFIRAHTYWG
jgi:hypothetical protein